jgi:hypothetical protein
MKIIEVARGCSRDFESSFPKGSLLIHPWRWRQEKQEKGAREKRKEQCHAGDKISLPIGPPLGKNSSREIFSKILLFAADSKGSRFQKKGEEALNPGRGNKQRKQSGYREKKKG